MTLPSTSLIRFHTYAWSSNDFIDDFWRHEQTRVAIVELSFFATFTSCWFLLLPWLQTVQIHLHHQQRYTAHIKAPRASAAALLAQDLLSQTLCSNTRGRDPIMIRSSKSISGCCPEIELFHRFWEFKTDFFHGSEIHDPMSKRGPMPRRPTRVYEEYNPEQTCHDLLRNSPLLRRIWDRIRDSWEWCKKTFSRIWWRRRTRLAKQQTNKASSTT